MYCNKCGVKVNEHDMFCYNCGNQLKNTQVVSQRVSEVSKSNHNCFNAFAIISFVIGLVSFLLLFSNYSGLNFIHGLEIFEDFEFILSINGMVFGILGIRSKRHRGKSITGLVLSSITTILSISMLILNYI